MCICGVYVVCMWCVCCVHVVCVHVVCACGMYVMCVWCVVCVCYVLDQVCDLGSYVIELEFLCSDSVHSWFVY